MMMNERAQFDLARRLRSDDDLPTLGEVFAFLSGLYFRGKLRYAKAFAAPAREAQTFWSSRRTAASFAPTSRSVSRN
jgi:hypothetical protein